MADTYTKFVETHTPVISSIYADGQKRYIKDKDARDAIDGILADYLKAADKTALETEIGKKVDKVEGMGLSHNDYSDTEKAEVAKIKDKQDTLAFEGEYNKESNKVVTKSALDEAIGAVAHLKLQVVDTLPTTDIKTDVIYLVPKAGKTGYTEWIRVNDAWEEIGDTDVDLSDYVQKTTTIAGVDLQDNITAAELRQGLNVSDGANKVEASETNGNIKIDGVETTVYTEVANTVHDADYKHITVTANSVSDGTTTFTKYDDTTLAGRVSDLEDAPANKIKDEDIAAWNAEKGANAAAKAADDKAVAEKTRAEGAEKALGDRIAVFEADGAHDVAALEDKVAALEGTSYEVTVGTETVTVPGQTVSTAAQTITGITAKGSISGTATISSSSADADATLTKADYTPAGSVSVSLKDADTATAADISRADYTPTGEVVVNLNNNEVLGSVTSAGETPSIDSSKFNGGTLTAASTATFVKKTINARVASDDDECLEFFEVASTDTNFYGTAVTAQGEYTAASIGDGFFSAGSMPTFATTTVGVSSATFNGTTETGLKVSGVTYKKQTVDAADFTGTKVEDFQVTGVSYKKVTVADTATVTASNVSLDVDDITVTAKEVAIADTTITVAKAGTYPVSKKASA